MSVIIKSGNSSDLVAVKPASTAPVVTDPALVVTLSPNSPALSVSVSNFPSTFAISNFPSIQAASQSGVWSIAVNNFPASQAVTGTFFQATQPVSVATLPLPSGASTEATLALIKAKTDNLDVLLSTRTKPADTQIISGSVSVSNFPVTQPVSGTVSISGTVPVSGTFFQATQPVSGTVAATQSGTWTVQPGNTANTTAWKVDGSATTQPVSGTFFQATQPISGTITANAGTGSFTVAQATAANLNATVVGSVLIPNFPATQPVSGTVTSNIGTTGGLALDTTLDNLVIAQGAALDANTQVMVGGSVTTSAPTYTTGQISPLSLNTSGALRTQDLKDAGRVIRVFTASFTAATTEALVTLTPNTDGTTGSTGTTFTVTSGKSSDLQTLMLTCFNATAAIHACQVNLRMTASGAVTTSSPIIGTIATTTAAATANLTNSQAQAFADGLELSGTMQFGISQIGIALAGQTVVLVGYEY